ncbi:hypothetical protein C8J57DRAFT_1321559 [Mycena rebaudengoi]|nr:hypothetical protein C8J57DRAFT_1321559 [Mycena rebaudengoi]
MSQLQSIPKTHSKPLHNPHPAIAMRPTMIILLLASLVLSARATDNCDWIRLHGIVGTVAQCTAFCTSCCAEFPTDSECPKNLCINDCRGV